jgi:hypothetical protein
MTKYGAYLAIVLAAIALFVGSLIVINGTAGELILLIRMLGAGIAFLGLAVVALATVALREQA